MSDAGLGSGTLAAWVVGPSGALSGCRELDLGGQLWSRLSGGASPSIRSGRMRLEDVLCALRVALRVEDSDARARAASAAAAAAASQSAMNPARAAAAAAEGVGAAADACSEVARAAAEEARAAAEEARAATERLLQQASSIAVSDVVTRLLQAGNSSRHPRLAARSKLFRQAAVCCCKQATVAGVQKAANCKHIDGCI